MRRLLRIALPLLVLAQSTVVGNVAFATQAPVPSSCVGEFTLTLSSPMTLPGVGPSQGSSFSLNPGGGFFVHCHSFKAFFSKSIQGWTTLGGWCGASWFTGFTDDGRLVEMVWSGGSLLVAGALVGVLHLSRSAHGCATGTPQPFTFVGALSDSYDACAGYGVMQTSSGSGPLAFGISFAFGGCAGTLSLFDAWGTMWGCGPGAVANGITSDGRTFTLSWSPGDILVLTGDVAGTVSVTPNVVAGGGCSGSGHFLARGGAAKRA